jgi:hypothetical protein
MENLTEDVPLAHFIEQILLSKTFRLSGCSSNVFAWPARHDFEDCAIETRVPGGLNWRELGLPAILVVSGNIIDMVYAVSQMCVHGRHGDVFGNVRSRIHRAAWNLYACGTPPLGLPPARTSRDSEIQRAGG